MQLTPGVPINTDQAIFEEEHAAKLNKSLCGKYIKQVRGGGIRHRPKRRATQSRTKRRTKRRYRRNKSYSTSHPRKSHTRRAPRHIRPAVHVHLRHRQPRHQRRQPRPTHP